MANAFDVLKERGFVNQLTHEQPLIDLITKERVTAYVGFDPTADSLHVGHMMAIMALAHLQRAGHRPLAVVGAGTAMIGDPSGRTELRSMMTLERIDHNAAAIKNQLAHYLDFSTGNALMVNNADWIRPLNYTEFLREIGSQFSVNRMLTAECFKTRMERGLSFIEFNYMLLQAYDYLMLYRLHGCRLQMGGDDQWSNILAGADLIRRLESAEAYGLTWALLTTSSGNKMGKTASGAVWLDPARTSPYDFYQYWRNTEDADVGRFLALYTFLPIEEVRMLGALRDREINEAKKILAFEITKLAHGEEEASKAQKAAEALFGGGGDLTSVPASKLTTAEVDAGINICELLVITNLAASKSEARRLIDGGGICLNDAKITDSSRMVTKADFEDDAITLRKGKKTFHRVTV